MTQPKRHSTRLAMKYKNYIPYTKEPLGYRFYKTLSSCQVPNCACKTVSNDLSEDLIDITYHNCAKRHHQKCNLLHR